MEKLEIRNSFPGGSDSLCSESTPIQLVTGPTNELGISGLKVPTLWSLRVSRDWERMRCWTLHNTYILILIDEVIMRSYFPYFDFIYFSSLSNCQLKQISRIFKNFHLYVIIKIKFY